jgi:hypothetical protein
MPKNIKIVKSFMSKEDSLFIEKFLKSVDSEFKQYGNGEKEFTFFTDFKDDEVLKILNSCGRLALSFIKNNYPGSFGEFDDSKTHIARFIEGPGMHEHFDTTRPNDIATLVYLNDNYEGGDIYFPEHDMYIKPDQGDLVCFPDNPGYIHGVMPITSGIRYTLPRWFTSIV